MSSLNELDMTTKFLKAKQSRFSLLQCSSSYPAPASLWGLNQIEKLRERYQVPVGFSDHSGDIYACLAATSLGAKILEFHVTFDQRSYGPDSTSSLNIDQVKLLTKGIREIEIALAHPIDKTVIDSHSQVKNIFEKSLSVNKHLPAGHILQRDDLESKKPKEMGLPAHSFEQVIGKKLSRTLEKWAFLTEQDIL